MATAYTSILKLALPVQGELSGTWGDVVNDNITSMVEEAIAGRAVINTWTTNSHTLTTADGTTSESRCAMLEFTDTGTALTGDATVVCPAQSKIYICKNDSGQKVTIKTSAGTGVAIADGQTMFVFCDGTNVEEAVTSMSSLKLGTAATSVEVTAVLDEDTMSSDSPTSLATQQSIKAYVDSQVTAQDLDFAGDSGTGAVDLDSQSLTIAGTTNEIETSAADQTLTIGLPDAVTVTTSVTTPTVQVTDVKANDGTAAVSIADSTGKTTIADAVLTTADINGGTIDGTTIGATTATTGAFTTVTSSGNTTVSGSLVTDTIAEETATAGVTVDGLLVKDTGIGVADASGTDVAGSDVTVRGGAGTGTGAGGELLFKVAPAGSTGSSVNALATGMKLDSTKALYVDTINELTSAAGVTIDSVLLKDDVVNATDIETSTISANDGTTAINIADSTGAVDIDTSLNVDGTITGDGLTIDGTGSIDMGTSTGTGLLIDSDNDTAVVGPHLKLNSGRGNTAAYNFLTVSNSDGNKLILDGRGGFENTPSTSGHTIFNKGNADANFQVRSVNNDNMFFVDAATDRVGINNSTPNVTLMIDATENNFFSETTTDGNIQLRSISGTATDGKTSSILYQVSDNSGSNNAFMELGLTQPDVASHDSQMFVNLRQGNGNRSNAMLLGSNGTLTLRDNATGANQGPFLLIDRDSATPADDDYAGSVRYRAKNDADETTNLVETYTRFTDVTDGAEDATFTTAVMLNGTMRSRIAHTTTETIINNSGQDLDFRVESVNIQNMFVVDADTDRVGVGTNSPDTFLHLSNQNFSTTNINNSIRITDTDVAVSTTQVTGQIEFESLTSTDPGVVSKIVSLTDTGASSTSNGNLLFYTGANASGLTERMRIKSSGELQLDSDSAFKTDSTATSATTQTAVYSFSATDYTGAKFLVCVTDSTATERYITELLVTHDGTTAVATEYGQVATDTALATFDVDISGGNVRLLATPASSNSMTFKVMSTQLLA